MINLHANLTKHKAGKIASGKKGRPAGRGSRTDRGVGCARRGANWEEKKKGGFRNRLCPHPVVQLTRNRRSSEPPRWERRKKQTEWLDCERGGRVEKEKKGEKAPRKATTLRRRTEGKRKSSKTKGGGAKNATSPLKKNQKNKYSFFASICKHEYQKP